MNDKYPTKEEREHEKMMAFYELLRRNFLLAVEVGILKKRLRGEKTEYSYWNGIEMVTADPLKLYDNLTGRVCEPPTLKIDVAYQSKDNFDLVFYVDWMVSQSQSRDAGKAAIPVVEKAKKVFNLVGLSHDEVMNLVLHFYDFCVAIKVSDKSIYSEEAMEQ